MPTASERNKKNVAAIELSFIVCSDVAFGTHGRA